MEELELKNEVIKGSLEIVKEFIKKIIPYEQIGGLISDQFGYLRMKNLVKIIEKTDKYLKAYNIKPQAIELKKLYPLINYASLEENDSLVEKWSILLTNSINPKKSKDIIPVYSEILNQLTPFEINFLDKFYDESIKIIGKEGASGGGYTGRNEIMSEFKISEEECEIFVDNLTRLYLLQNTAGSYTFNKSNYRINNELMLTKLGLSFIKACRIK